MDMNRIHFTVNGVEHSALAYLCGFQLLQIMMWKEETREITLYSMGCEVSSDVMLVDYLRNTLELRGTKYMCREAGCGACIVVVVKCPGAPVQTVNSCMITTTSCQGWRITTIEDVGNRKKGYHILQKSLADGNGTQCGHCTPAWIMSMYSLLKSKKRFTMLEVEESFGGNVCRCTGYRPILQTFKRFAIDAPKDNRVLDIEDLYICKNTCQNSCTTQKCETDDWCIINKEDIEGSGMVEIKLRDGKYWYRVCEVHDIFRILKERGTESYMLVYGNTAKGAYPIFEYPQILIDISGIRELKGCEVDQNLKIGAGVTLTELLDIFKTYSEHEYFGYLIKFYDHLKLVAHIPVRNLGSLAGNLMIKHQHNDFPSDLFLMFATVGAVVATKNMNGFVNLLDMEQFLKTDMRGVVILYVLLPPLTKEYLVVTFKIMPRSQNAHAIVNAGFMYKINKKCIVEECRIVYGGLSPSFVRASVSEAYLIGKILFKNETLQETLKILDTELVVTENPPEPTVKYRKKLALNLFYKGLLTLCSSDILDPSYKSGRTKIHETRPVSEARQIFDTDPTLWPLNQPIPKVEALIQCAGEAKYTEDLPKIPNEVFASLVLSNIAVGEIVNIDPCAALKMQGVIKFYSAKDIPGENTFIPVGEIFYVKNEEIFCSGKVKYFNQPIGMIVAETQHIADRAAKLVVVVYKNVKKPIIDIKEAKNDPDRNTVVFSKAASERGEDVFKVIKGGNTIYGQYHFVMETLVCVTKPTEEGLEVHTAGQWLDGTQAVISKALKMNCNKIDVHVRRLGGAYGLKISRSLQVAVACSLAVYKLNRPCRSITQLRTVTRAMGKRFPCSTDFEVGVNKSGVIQHMDYKLCEDNGYIASETLSLFGRNSYNNCYNDSRWNFTAYDSVTDNAKNTWCRSPGKLENIAMAEYVLEQISYELSLDPFEVRLANLDKIHFKDLIEMSATLKKTAQYTERRANIIKYNKQNSWKKRGLRTAFLKWTPSGSQYLTINISVYHADGTVTITHSGIEMGQGINTKAVQICAYLLNIPTDLIQIKATSTIVAANSTITGGSVTCQNIGICVQRCCMKLLKKLAPIKQKLGNPTWKELVYRAYFSNIDLQTHSFVSFGDVEEYQIYGVAIAEAEIDTLTGEHEILRIDVLQDVGLSTNPELDVGQVEGAFIMGLGYWTSELLKYNNDTGELLTDRTWNYTVPMARDIPQDFRIYFRKNSYSTELYLGAKATGEPPMCLSIVIAFAIREAIAAAREQSGIPTTKWFNIDGPYTVEKICLACENRIEDYKFN